MPVPPQRRVLAVTVSIGVCAGVALAVPSASADPSPANRGQSTPHSQIQSTPAAPPAGSIVVANLNNGGSGSLRKALKQANGQRAASVIAFTVNGTITLKKALPAVKDQVQIDGTTAPGFIAGGPPVVELDMNGRRGMRFVAGSSSSQLLGFAITNARGAGVRIDSKAVTVNNNYIGLDATGQAAPNGGPGVDLTAGSGKNLIGLNPSGDSGVVGNVISGNKASGIRLTRSSRNTIVANRIGTNPSGTTAMANRRHGIELTTRSRKNTIGGAAYVDAATGLANNPTGDKGTVPPVFVVPPLGNLISGNRRNGMLIKSRSKANVLSGNFIGTTADGDSALGNGWDGVRINKSAKNSLIGCTFVENPFVYYNVVSGNGRNGLHITDSNKVVVQANFFGVGANNTNLLPNRKNGILVDGSSAGTQVGGVIPLGNVSAGNGRNGIAVKDTASEFTTFNTFGGLLAFKGAAPNGRNGLLITSSGRGNVVRTNVFSGNQRNGIKLTGDARRVKVDPNIVGATTVGKEPLPNGGNGIVIKGNAKRNVIGGTTSSVIPQNTFSGNLGYGVVISGKAHHNRLLRSFVGTKVLGIEVLANQKGGVLLKGKANNNVIGKANLEPANLISGNNGNGVTMQRKTYKNRVVDNYVGLDRLGRALPNTGAGVVDQGTGNKVIGS